MKLKKILMLAVAGSSALWMSGVIYGHGESDHQPGKEHRESHGGKSSGHDHDHNYKKGPNGGRLVTSVKPAFEITVDKERKVRILFVDDENKPLPLAEQSISGITGERTNPIRLEFTRGKEKEENVLISDKSLPDGDHVALVLAIKETPDAKTVIERLTLHLHLH